jgi:RNA-directed DNA polymerase
VIDADIRGAFDTIAHEHLLRTIGDVPGKGLIRQWLKAGYMEKGVFHDTDAGTPQGGVVSPLLANIALHGMEQALGVKHDAKGILSSSRAVVRYADDFVVFCESRADAEQATGTLRTWLAERGLALSEEKTRIVHLTEGFDFLSYNVRHYKDATTPTGWKLLITPSDDAVARIKVRLRAAWKRLLGAPVAATLNVLNPIIRGWANYHRVNVASRTFLHLDYFLYKRAFRWAKRTHPNKPWSWRKRRYWGRLNPRRASHWTFGDKQTGGYLLRFTDFGVKRHVLVRGKASPDDPTLAGYWQDRKAKHADHLPTRHQRAFRRQRGTCPICGDSLSNDEELQTHHLHAKGSGGDRSLTVLLHRYCHQKVTSLGAEHFADLLEPYAVRVARTVLRGEDG